MRMVWEYFMVCMFFDNYHPQTCEAHEWYKNIIRKYSQLIVKANLLWQNLKLFISDEKFLTIE